MAAVGEALAGRIDEVRLETFSADHLENDYRGVVLGSLVSARAPALEIWHLEGGGGWDMWIESFFYEEGLDFAAGRHATVARITAAASGGLGRYRRGWQHFTILGNHREIAARWPTGKLRLVSEMDPILPGLTPVVVLPDAFYVRRGT